MERHAKEKSGTAQSPAEGALPEAWEATVWIGQQDGSDLGQRHPRSACPLYRGL